MNRIFLLSAFIWAAAVLAAQAQTFDLQREIDKAEKQTLPYFAHAIEENTDVKVALTVDAASFGSDAHAWGNLNIVANRILGALSDVGRDQMGKDALARDVKKVMIVKIAESAEDAVELKEQTVYVRTSASDQAMTVLQNRIVAALEKALPTGHPPIP